MIYFVKKHRIILGLIFAIVIGIFLFRDQEIQGTESDVEYENPVELPQTAGDEVTASTIMVDIKGEIQNPGVYEIAQGTRVIDVIKIAGGFSEAADENQINLAQMVHDEMVLIIPKIGEDSVQLSSTTNQNEHKLKVNVATKEEIEQLNGIGPAKAQAIIDYREENGLFQQVDDLLQVNGIGEKTLENLKDYIIIP